MKLKKGIPEGAAHRRHVLFQEEIRKNVSKEA
jgi:hypothetical protein